LPPLPGSPKFQAHWVICPPPFCWELSVNCTGVSTQSVGDQENLEMGLYCMATGMVCEAVHPSEVVTVKVTW